MKWEETQFARRGEPYRRDLEWTCIAQQIAHMNRPYTR